MTEAKTCAYVRCTRPADYRSWTEPEYEECSRAAIEGSEYCKRHRDCEESEEA